MTEIIERIVKSEGVPSKNDLWLKKDGENLSIEAYDNGEWKQVSSSGGGSAEGAVSYNEQTLTEAQQMQARKNQGLYYKETLPGGTITWDGDTSDREIFNDILYKVADTPTYISPSSWRSLTLKSVIQGQEPVEQETSIEQESVVDLSSRLYSGEAFGAQIRNRSLILVANNAIFEEGLAPLNGVYFYYQQIEEEAMSGYGYVSSFTYGESVTVSQIPLEYIPDLTIYIDYPVGGNPVISRGEDLLGQFVEALKGGAGSPKIVVKHGMDDRFYTYTEFSMEYTSGSDGYPDSFAIYSRSFDASGNNDTTSVTISGNYEDGVCSNVRVSIGDFNE